jgi:hypothetical protein
MMGGQGGEVGMVTEHGVRERERERERRETERG